MPAVNSEDAQPQTSYCELRGEEVRSHLADLARLRIAVFREFPYLYDGDPDSEADYLQVYPNSAHSLVVLLQSRGEVVGATTCLPMVDEGAEFQAPFREAGLPLDEIFYFGESVILPEHRGRGAGHEFFARREHHARELGFRYTTFCAVDRPPDHPRRPPGYRPLDSFWSRMGYQRRDDLRCEFSWKELDESAASPKKLTFWLRDWS